MMICYKKWLKLHVQYADISSNQIRRKNDGLYTWLKRYDSEWLKQNYRRIKTKVNSVDWAKRDAELLSQVKEVVREMKEGKPERITWTTIGSKLGISGWLSKKREKLPLTKAYIESTIESMEEFHIRKIKWAIDELEKQGKPMTLWNLAETAGVKPRYMKFISKDIKGFLNGKGYGYNFLQEILNVKGDINE
ncbi:hypothetical protein D2962_14665 [Biomaibacter acetigenes]|uniref:Transposon Tn7 transposition protein TnsD C-terminal domain-containing protein n=1 Tax=Biomaibacter acetigenes TaxID=2316383 RepID=A0A3G2R8D7_9FIRM|nr:TnsD family Tn7-like transposition protein [Biomaibacter acetigenes]AYO31673.1 hypothetical protein D2962_14665 [Biomaibacter acetigenes]RKL62634.1 hypothetical protein DXT63_10735 [Thermoanaerobacteraceae bacterium SP2]